MVNRGPICGRWTAGDGRRYIDEDTDWNYAPLDGEGTTNHKLCTTISDFMTAYTH